MSVGIFISQDKKFINLVGDMDYEDVVEKELLRPINVAKGFISEINILKKANQ